MRRDNSKNQCRSTSISFEKQLDMRSIARHLAASAANIALVAGTSSALLAAGFLPKPEQPFAGVIDPGPNQSKLGWPKPIKAPDGVPHIVLILLDDVGFGDKAGHAVYETNAFGTTTSRIVSSVAVPSGAANIAIEFQPDDAMRAGTGRVLAATAIPENFAGTVKLLVNGQQAEEGHVCTSRSIRRRRRFRRPTRFRSNWPTESRQ